MKNFKIFLFLGFAFLLSFAFTTKTDQDTGPPIDETSIVVSENQNHIAGVMAYTLPQGTQMNECSIEENGFTAFYRISEGVLTRPEDNTIRIRPPLLLWESNLLLFSTPSKPIRPAILNHIRTPLTAYSMANRCSNSSLS